MYYILLYDVVDDYINKRAPFREDHLRVATEAALSQTGRFMNGRLQ